VVGRRRSRSGEVSRARAMRRSTWVDHRPTTLSAPVRRCMIFLRYLCCTSEHDVSGANFAGAGCTHAQVPPASEILGLGAAAGTISTAR
jgi:hypothetical protein